MSEETTVQAVETKVEEVVNEVKQEAEKAEQSLDKKIVQLTSEEKLYLREVELEYLKAVMETQRLQKVIEEKAKAFPAYVDTLVKKYGLEKDKYTFDAVANAFRQL